VTELDDLDVEIVAFLLGCEASLPEVAKKVGAPLSTVEYRLYKMVKAGIVVVKEPKRRFTVRTYGRRYTVNPKLGNPGIGVSLSLLAVFISVVLTFALYSVYQFRALVLLIIPTIIAVKQVIKEQKERHKRNAEEILKNFDNPKSKPFL